MKAKQVFLCLMVHCREKHASCCNDALQVGKSSGNISGISARDSAPVIMDKGSMAVYKGLKVVVYIVDKTEISLTHQDLVELIKVRQLQFKNLRSSNKRIEVE